MKIAEPVATPPPKPDREAFADALKKRHDEVLNTALLRMDARAESVALEAASDLIKIALGLEFDRWDHKWKYRHDKDNRILSAAANEAAAKVADSLDFPEVVLTAKEADAIRSAYRRTFVATLKTSAIRRAEEAAEEEAERLVGSEIFAADAAHGWRRPDSLHSIGLGDDRDLDDDPD